MSGGPMKAHLNRVGMAAITDEDVRRDQAMAFQICLGTMRAALIARQNAAKPPTGA